MSIHLVQQHSANNLIKCTRPSFTVAHNKIDTSAKIIDLCPLVSNPHKTDFLTLQN